MWLICQGWAHSFQSVSYSIVTHTVETWVLKIRSRGKIHPSTNIILFEVKENFCSFMKWWHFIGLQIALKKMAMALRQGTCKLCRGKAKDYCTEMSGIFSVTIMNRQGIDGHLPQMVCPQTKGLKRGIWGHRSFGEGLSWEGSSKGLLIYFSFGWGRPCFPVFQKKKKGRYFLLCVTWGTIPKMWPTKNRAKVALSHLRSCSDTGLDTGQWISVQIRAARRDSSDLH